jgi:threonine dehydrogenase-like Zn-dependent dehydrogenase
MQGLVLYPDGHYHLKEVPKPEIGKNPFAPSDVLIEVAFCGICGSDVHKWKDADRKGLKGPSKAVVSGHEMSGTVTDVGPAVTDFKPGDRVVGEIVTFYCGKCINCRTGRINICANMIPADQRIHYISGGAFAKYAVWPEKHLHHLPDSIGLKEAVLIEPTAGSFHSLIERMGLQAGESLLILGPGARGLILLQIARAVGAFPVIITGLTRDEKARLSLARELGADAVVNVERENLLEIVKSMTGGIGADVVVENTGSPQAVEETLDLVRPGGRILISGGGIRGGITACLDTRKIIVKELDIKGEISHLWTSWRSAIQLVAQGKVKLQPLVSHVFPLRDWERAFDLAASSAEALRIALTPE